MDDALSELEKLDPRQAEIVELRFFGGLTIEEIAKVLKISPATVKREWTTAKLWLQRHLSELQSPKRSLRPPFHPLSWLHNSGRK